MYLIVITCLVLGMVLYRSVKLLYKRQKQRLPPGPKGYPLVGTLTLDTPLTLLDHREKYGDISCVKFAGVPMVYLHSAKAANESYANKELWDRQDSSVKVLIFDKGVMLHSNREDYWTKLRKMMHTTLRAYGRGIDHIEEVITDELTYTCTSLSKKCGNEFDILELLSNSLCNVLYSLMIGERFDYDSRMIYTTRRAIDIENSLCGPVLSTFLVMFPWVQYLPVKLGARIRECQQLRAEFMDGIFARGKNLHDDQSGIFFHFLRAQKDNDWLKTTHIKGVIDDILSAGLVTTLGSLYAFCEIMLHYLDVQTCIQQEIDDVIGTTRHPKLSDRKNMPYTEATIYEVLRYTAIVPLVIPKTCENDTTLLGYDIPKGSQIWANLFRIHHDPDTWPDPWTFNPLRFLDENNKLVPSNHPNRKNMLPFGGGPRMCIGEVFAKTRMFLYITHFLQRFSFLPGDKLQPCDPRTYTEQLVARPQRYTMMIVER